MYHFLQRHIVQAGGLQSCNIITKLVAYFFYYTDWAWLSLDSQYYVKRQAMFGQNFVSVLSVVVGKYDEFAENPDSFDARILTIPQRRGFFLGNNRMDPSHQYYNGHEEAMVPLFVSDPGATMNPNLPFYQPNHNILRSYLTQHLLGEKQVNQIIERQTDGTSRVLLNDFGRSVKGVSDRKQLYKCLTDFLPRFMFYTIFDVPVHLIPIDDLKVAHTSIRYVIYHYKLPSCVDAYTKPNRLRDALERVADFLMKHSRVLKDVPDGPDGLTKRHLIEMMQMVFGIAAFQGTLALAICCLTQMPKGYADGIITDEEDLGKLRNAVLECARMNTPVSGAHSIVDDDEGFVTKIGGKNIKFPKGTTLFTGMNVANLDEKRFPNPFVFDPENRDFSKLTSFHSVGESTNTSAPRICPGREVALSMVMLMIKAKLGPADKGGPLVDGENVEIELAPDFTLKPDEEVAAAENNNEDDEIGDIQSKFHWRTNQGFPLSPIPLRSTVSSPI